MTLRIILADEIEKARRLVYELDDENSFKIRKLCLLDLLSTARMIDDERLREVIHKWSLDNEPDGYAGLAQAIMKYLKGGDAK